MSEIVTAIYEQGVLRPLTPLSLPENARVQIQIIEQLSNTEERQRVRQALLEAGVIRPQALVEPVEPVTEAELIAAAKALAVAGPLSELILAERDER